MNKIKDILKDINSFVAENEDSLESFRIKYGGKKGIFKALSLTIKNLEVAEKKIWGKNFNLLKQQFDLKYQSEKNRILQQVKREKDNEDFTLPGGEINAGSLHPLSIIRGKIEAIFSSMGFTISQGPEIEDDWHNFTALNFLKDHPARDMQDTFFIEKRKNASPMMLRSHTSNVQIRLMETQAPPIRAIIPGRVYRNETISARSHCLFHQVEGIYIDQQVSFVDLKQCVFFFIYEMFGKKTKVRFRPSFFPFTEPSVEVDITCFICNAKGCSVCKDTGWVEIMGCGMVNPIVLDNCKVDSQKYSGYAFGMGIERITMLKYGIADLRLFFENDIRFLRQFTQTSITN